jgi:hypothetical protein
MSTVHAHLDESLDEAATTLRQVAGEEGCAFAEGESSPPTVLVFKKGTTAISWGSQITVNLESAADSATKLTFTTKETWAVTDWGRGRRQIAKLLNELGAEKD